LNSLRYLHLKQLKKNAPHIAAEIFFAFSLKIIYQNLCRAMAAEKKGFLVGLCAGED